MNTQENNEKIANETFKLTQKWRGAERSPLPPPRGIPQVNSQQEFYQHPNTKTNVLSTPLAFLMRSSNNTNFEQLHERFRQLVMKDVLEYQAQRELKSQPLIEL